ncbi:hypothetical protein HAX54_051596, partial [Datura stramonium]|nr:hypothetical protein [Datura stramonium]
AGFSHRRVSVGANHGHLDRDSTSRSAVARMRRTSDPCNDRNEDIRAYNGAQQLTLARTLLSQLAAIQTIATARRSR